jgi:hypothetical protein
LVEDGVASDGSGLGLHVLFFGGDLKVGCTICQVRVGEEAVTFKTDIESAAKLLHEADAKERQEEAARDAQLRAATNRAAPAVESLLHQFGETVWGAGRFHIETEGLERITAAGYWRIIPTSPAERSDGFQLFTHLARDSWDSPARVVFRTRDEITDPMAETIDDSREALEAMLHGLLLSEEERELDPCMQRVRFTDKRAFPALRPSSVSSSKKRAPRTWRSLFTRRAMERVLLFLSCLVWLYLMARVLTMALDLWRS